MHLKTNKTGSIPILDAPFHKKILKELKGVYEPTLFAQKPLPSNVDWAEKIYTVNFVGAVKGSVNVNFAHLCGMEARFLLEGEMIVAGVPLTTDVGRCDFKDLRRQIWNATIDDLDGLIKNGGWLCKQSAGDLVVCPSGFLIIMIPVETCFGLRWAMSSDNMDTERCKLYLNEVIAKFPEISNPSTGYGQWLKWLSTM